MPSSSSTHQNDDPHYREIHHHNVKYKYLTLVPRGLDAIAIKVISKRLTCHSYSCHDIGFLMDGSDFSNDQIDKWKGKLRKQEHKRRERINNQKKKKQGKGARGKRERNDHLATSDSTPKNDADNDGKAKIEVHVKDSMDDEHDSIGPSSATGPISTNIQKTTAEDDSVVGTIQDPEDNIEISIGYHSDRSNKSNAGGQTSTILSRPGQIEGVKILYFVTNAPSHVVASIRGMGCGPLLAPVSTSCTFGSKFNIAPGPSDTKHGAAIEEKEQVSDEEPDEYGHTNLNGIGHDIHTQRHYDGSSTTVEDRQPSLSKQQQQQQQQQGQQQQQAQQQQQERARTVLTYEQSLNDAISSITQLIQSVDYISHLRNALLLWYDHAKYVWKCDRERHEKTSCSDDGTRDFMKRGVGLSDDNGEDENDMLERKLRGQIPFAYRVSCVRTHSKKYQYKREDLVPEIAHVTVPADAMSGSDLLRTVTRAGVNMDEPAAANRDYDNVANDEANYFATSGEVDKHISKEGKTDATSCMQQNDTGPNKNRWYVDLQKYDFELLTILHNNHITIAIPLRPYRHLSAKSYSSGIIPPDVMPPYLCGSISSGIIRLRPSTAALLLHLANIRPGDVVLDPCAGLGTIPVETALSESRCFGLGGDVVLGAYDSTGLGHVASSYLSRVRGYQKEQQLRSIPSSCMEGRQVDLGGAADLMAWDASLLPIRDETVDVVVSDLPFGQKCMSTNKLSGFLPLLMYELGRVLRRNEGRMVLLCGTYRSILEAIEHQNATAAEFCRSNAGGDGEKPVFKIPCASVFPVNIGGLTAWVVIVERGEGVAVPVKNHRDRSRKLTLLRQRVGRIDEQRQAQIFEGIDVQQL